MNSDGSIYAGRGAILPEDDPIALKHLNMVTTVHGDSTLVIPKPKVIIGAEPTADDLSTPADEEDKEDDPRVWPDDAGFSI